MIEHPPVYSRRRRATRAGFGALAVGVVLVLTPSTGASAVRHSNVAQPSPAPRPVVDAAGRQLLLRGVNVNALVQYNIDYQEAVPISADDLREMAALGFNFIRLAVSWSRIAPHPGTIDHAYLAQVAQVAHWAADNGIYTVVDMHQDRYNRHLWAGNEVDGAPDWATLTNGTPCTPILPSPLPGETTMCVQVAFDNFWRNVTVSGRPLQTWYADALVALALSVRDNPMIAGVEMMNEPTPGLLFSGFETAELYPFYQRTIAALRSAGETRPLWFEPSILRDLTDSAAAQAMPFSHDPGLVYTVHVYTDTFSPPFNPNDAMAHLRFSYQNAALEAAIFGTPWVDDEFGGGSGSAWDGWLRRQHALQDEFTVGSGFWVWKQRPGFYNWQTVEAAGSIRRDTERAQILSLPHVDAVPGHLVSVAGDENGLRAQVTGPGGTALLWSGTEVVHGGVSVIPIPFTSVEVDGKAAASACRWRTFATGITELRGCVIAVNVPTGTHTLALFTAGAALAR